MLLDYIRLLHFDSSLTDYSLRNNSLDEDIPLALESDDYLYIGQQYPFTNIYFHMDSVNAVTGNMNVEYWDGTDWRAGVDVLDGTLSGNAPLGKSGNYKFSLNEDYDWNCVANTSDSVGPTELSGQNIYNCYWLRLQPSATLTSGTDASEIGYAFTTTDQLKAFDVEIDSFLTAFDASKTDWVDQIKTASRIVVSDLKRKGIIEHAGQISQFSDIWIPTTLKTLSIIYSNLGPSYDERLKKNEHEYEKALSPRRMTIDENKDGHLDRREISGRIVTRVR